MSALYNEFLNAVTSRPYSTARGFIKINCPACGDKRKRGGFAPTPTGGFRYSCFNGGCTFNDKPTGWEVGSGLYGRVKNLFDMLGGDTRNVPTSELIRRRSERANAPTITIANKFPSANMPPNSILLDDAASQNEDAFAVFEYLYNRSPLFIDTDFPFMWSPKYPHHVLVPYIHYNDQIVGYMGRCIHETSGAERFIQRAPSNFMFNQYTLRTDTSPYVLIVESPLDAILLQGVATRSNRLSEKQINLINLSNRTPILVPDLSKTDAGPYILAAEQNKWLVSAPEWAYKDAGEAITSLGLLSTIETIMHCKTDRYKRHKIRFGIKST